MQEELKILKDKKIALLTGGLSHERAIALKTGEAVKNALKKLGLKFIKIDLQEKTREDIFTIIKKSGIDVVFLALHGKYGEDGTIQGGLDIIKVPYIGSGTLGSALAMDKLFSKQIFIQNNILTPEYEILNKGNTLKMRLPVVIKPVNGGSTIGISIVEAHKGLKKALNTAFKYSNKVFAERYIKGTEITVPIFNDEPLTVIEIVPKEKFYNYKAKYVKGMSTHILPARLKNNLYKKAQEIALKAHKSLSLSDFSRVDMILSKDKKLYVLEVNSLPGLTVTSLLPEALRFAGISFEQMVLKILARAVFK